jgi:hypothetical protein
MTKLSRQQLIDEKRKFWKQHLNLWQDSDLSQAEYCRQNNLDKNQWGYWKQRFVKTESSTEFIALPVNRSLTLLGSSSLNLVVNDQYRIEINPGFDPNTLKMVLNTIQQLR